MVTPVSHTEQGSDLKQAFLRHLPERIGAIEENWRSLSHDGWDQSKLTQLLQRIQDLAGSAGKFGLIQVSESVFSLELYFKAFIDGGAQHASAQQMEEVNGLIKSLKAVAKEEEPPHADALLRSHDQIPRIFYLRFNDMIAPGLNAALEAAHCSVLAFHRCDDLLREFAAQPPAAIVIDAQMLPQIKPITDAISQISEKGSPPPPLTIISNSSSLDIRLAAMRSGAEAFFVTPIDASAVAARIKQLATPKEHGRFRIMVVDDDPSQANFAATILRKADMETCVVNNPMQVLNSMDTFRPDLILMDLYMPEVDGIELTSIIREQNEFVGIPIIFVSGEQDTDKQLDALSVGGDDFIAKPIRPRYLITTIKNRVQRAHALRHQPSNQSHRDAITGLFNRRHFFERLDKAVTSNTTLPSSQGVLYAKLDATETIQKQIGIGQSDALLAEMGTIIAESTEPQDVAARIDESGFAILAKRPLDKNLLQMATDLLQAVAEHTFSIEPSTSPLTLSIGVCFFNAAPDDASGLVSRASKAWAIASEEGGNRVHVYQTPAVESTDFASGPSDTLALLKEALASDAFQVLFQPFVNLRDKESENYEMMLRLRTDEGDLISATDFLPLAKSANLLLDVDRCASRQALRVMHERRQAGHAIKLLITQSAQTLTDDTAITWLRNELRSRLLVGTGLILEFNLVDAASNLKRTKAFIDQIHELGVCICLARFGHNDASYKVLQYLGADYIKIIEKLLIADNKIITNLVQRAHELGTQVIVPRVDDPRLISHPWLSGADFVQGNTIQHPREKPDYDFSEQLTH
jgi:diguanylate cyclase (GGDEF)-like protein